MCMRALQKAQFRHISAHWLNRERDREREREKKRLSEGVRER